MDVKVLLLGVFLGLNAKMILEYRPGVNYGQVFKDYSGNGWHGISGSTSAIENSDVIPTDRGGFLDGSKFQKITLPSNDACKSSFSLSSPFLIALWLFIDADQDGLVFSRYQEIDMVNNYFYLRRNKANDALALKVVINGNIKGEDIGQNLSFFKDKWCLIGLSVLENTFQVYQNNVLMHSLTTQSIYQETENFAMQIGGTFNNLIGSKFFLWTFIIDSENDQSKYISNTATSTCIVSGCTLCSPAIVDRLGTGCLSKEKNEFRDSNKISCPTTTPQTGCSGSTSLVCGCDFQSCVLSGTSSLCECPLEAISSSTTCVCPLGQTIRWDICCESSCLTCLKTDPNSCLTCVDSNAVIDVIGCKCKEKYFVEGQITSVNPCIPCHHDCRICNNIDMCLECIATNSVPHVSKGCVCMEKFFNITSLITVQTFLPCNIDCLTCSSSLFCLTCIDSNAQPYSNGGCSCKAGFFNLTSLTKDGNCQPCHPDCLTCITYSFCLICKAINAIPSISGCTCKDRFFKESFLSLSATNACSACNPECSKCDKFPECLSCIAKNAQ
jgi:hypothetical protein